MSCVVSAAVFAGVYGEQRMSWHVVNGSGFPQILPPVSPNGEEEILPTEKQQLPSISRKDSGTVGRSWTGCCGNASSPSSLSLRTLRKPCAHEFHEICQKPMSLTLPEE